MLPCSECRPRELFSAPVRAGTVAEECGFEVAGAEPEPWRHAPDPAVGLVGDVAAGEGCDRDVAIAGARIGDDIAARS